MVVSDVHFFYKVYGQTTASRFLFLHVLKTE